MVYCAAVGSQPGSMLLYATQWGSYAKFLQWINCLVPKLVLAWKNILLDRRIQ